MKIFENFERKKGIVFEYNTPIYKFINLSPKEEIDKTRNLINNWYINYPDVQKKSIGNRLKSENDEIFYSAFFELYSYHFLNKFLEITPNEQYNSIGKMYDFNVVLTIM